MCRVVERRSVRRRLRLVESRATESISRLVIEYVACRIKEILHETDRDKLVYTDGTDTSSVAPSHVVDSTGKIPERFSTDLGIRTKFGGKTES